MSEHKANVIWARNGADFGYKTYPRDHVWRFPNGVEVPGSAAPAYLGNPQRVDPEAAVNRYGLTAIRRRSASRVSF